MESTLVTPTADGGVLVPDSCLLSDLLEKRRESGADRFDEVWDGVYVMHATPNDDHQDIVTRFSHALVDLLSYGLDIGEVRAGINIARNRKNWDKDYRIPDVVVFLRGSKAGCHGAFWTGAADFVVEILSPRDKAREKLDFYADLGTREVLLIDRDPWRLELHRHDGQSLPLVARVELDGDPIASQSVPILLKLTSGDPRPRLALRQAGQDREWLV